MQVKTFLRGVRKMNIAIEAKKRQRESLYYTVTGRAITYADMKVQTSGDGDKLEKTLAEVADLDRQITNDIRKLVTDELKATEMINSLSKPEYIAILTDYYINTHTWDKVADLNGYSVQHTKRIHGYALRELKDKYETI